MISGVTIDIAGQPETFRMTTRAMMQIEQRFDVGLIEALQGLETGFHVTHLVWLIGATANDGSGVDDARAQEIVDEIGLARAGDLLGKVSEAAFPEASSEKNPKRAARIK